MPVKDNHYFETLPGQMDLEDMIAEAKARDAAAAAAARLAAEQEAARHDIGGNGAPLLDVPSYAALERIARPVHGPLWEGKLALDIAVDPRSVRRWRAGEGSPTPRAMALTISWALRTAKSLLASVGEDDLAWQVQRVIDRKVAGAVERGRAIHAESVAMAKAAAYVIQPSAAEVAAEQRARAAQWARTRAETRARPGPVVSLIRLTSRVPRPARPRA